MDDEQLQSLREFAADHLVAHARACYFADDDDAVVVSGSEHPATGIRFLSLGLEHDARAMSLTGMYTSEPTGMVRE